MVWSCLKKNDTADNRKMKIGPHKSKDPLVQQCNLPTQTPCKEYGEDAQGLANFLNAGGTI